MGCGAWAHVVDGELAAPVVPSGIQHVDAPERVVAPQGALDVEGVREHVVGPVRDLAVADLELPK